MRVITGIAKGRKLMTPPGLDIRPTADKIKEAIFSMIASDIINSKFLDIFSGAGGIGIEALSRGAESAVFIDNSKKSVETVNLNLQHTKLEDKGRVLFGDVFSQLKKLSPEKFDIIFLDPPYNKGYIEKTIKIIREQNLLCENGYIIAEQHVCEPFADISGVELLKNKKYGLTNIAFYTASC